MKEKVKELAEMDSECAHYRKESIARLPWLGCESELICGCDCDCACRSRSAN